MDPRNVSYGPSRLARRGTLEPNTVQLNYDFSSALCHGVSSSLVDR